VQALNFEVRVGSDGIGSAAFFDYSLEEHHVVAAALPTAPSTLTLYQLRTSKGAIPSLGDVLLVRSLTATK
jgi:hypothetical protein